jgi:multiple sugar transport system substrate-binding protein
MRIRTISTLLLALMIVLPATLSGCGPKAVEQPTATQVAVQPTKEAPTKEAPAEQPTDLPTKEPAPAKEEVVINFWHPQDVWKPPNGVGIKLLEDFNERHKGEIRVELNWLASAQMNDAVQMAAAANELPDVFMNRGLRLPDLLKGEQMIRPLNDLVPDGWMDRFADGAFAEGINVDGETIYSWPERYPNHAGLMFYNKDVMKKAGLDPERPPETWDELQEMAQKVTEAGKGEFYGIAGSSDGSTSLMVLGALLAKHIDPSIGGTCGAMDFWDWKQGKFRFNDPAMKEGIEFFLQLKADGSIMPGALNTRRADARVRWGEGKAAFHFEPQWVINIVIRDLPPFEFGVTSVPGPTKDSQLYLQGVFPQAIYYVGKDAPDEVGVFIDEVLTSPEYFQLLIEKGIILTANTEANKRDDLHPWPVFSQYVELSNETVRISPVLSNINPDAQWTAESIKLSPAPWEVLRDIFASDGADLDKVLDEYNQQMEDALDQAIEEAQALGKNVSREDFTLPNWDPTQHWTSEDYAQVKSMR